VEQSTLSEALAKSKVWYLYDLNKLLTLVTNVLYRSNDLSFITLLCTAEGCHFSHHIIRDRHTHRTQRQRGKKEMRKSERRTE